MFQYSKCGQNFPCYIRDHYDLVEECPVCNGIDLKLWGMVDRILNGMEFGLEYLEETVFLVDEFLPLSPPDALRVLQAVWEIRGY